MPNSPLIRNAFGALDFSRISILVIDDNHFIRRLICRLLRSFGVGSLTELDDAAQALKLLQEHHFDVVICDLLMEPMNGIDFVREVRTGAGSLAPSIPIIMLTGYTEYENVLQARDAGVDDLLAKPVSAKSLLARLIAVFENPRPFPRTKAADTPEWQIADIKAPDREAGRGPGQERDQAGKTRDEAKSA